MGEAREALERAGELMVIIIVTHFLFSFCLDVVKKFTVIHRRFMHPSYFLIICLGLFRTTKTHPLSECFPHRRHLVDMFPGGAIALVVLRHVAFTVP
jgi:hypothetical protein